MKFAIVQEEPIISPKQIAQDLEKILTRYGYVGGNVEVRTGPHYQVCYEIPSEGAVYLNATERPAGMNISAQVLFLGFRENGDTYKNLERELIKLIERYRAPLRP